MKLRLLLACGAVSLTAGLAPEARAQGVHGPAFFSSGYGVAPPPAPVFAPPCGYAQPVAPPPCAYGPPAYGPPVWGAPAPYGSPAPYPYGYGAPVPPPAPYGYGPPVSGRAIIPPGVRVIDVPYGAAPGWGAPPPGPQGYFAPPLGEVYVSAAPIHPYSPPVAYQGSPIPRPLHVSGSGIYPETEGQGELLSARPPYNLQFCNLLRPGMEAQNCFLPREQGGPAIAYWDGWRIRTPG